MKTLDKVIKAFEYTYENDPIAWIYGADALHYLREYRDRQHQLDIDIAEHHRSFEQLGVEISRYQKAKAEMEKILADYVALKQWWTEQQENPPLILDELKQMGGKPVWIEYMEEDGENEWVLVVKNPERPMFGIPKLLAFSKDGERMYLTISGYGKRWQAYKNEK